MPKQNMAIVNFKPTAKTTIKNKAVLSAMACTVILLGACENKNTANLDTAPTVEQETPLDPHATTATDAAWQLANQGLQACVADSQQLRSMIRQLLEAPSADTLNQSRAAWRQAHTDILAFSVFFSLADSNPGLFGELASHRYNLDAHPIQPGFIDYFDVYPVSGIVNDMAITLSAEALRQQHGITDDSDVSIGFHAMEYLLWGEHGERPPTDFVSANTVNSEQAQQGLRVVDLPNNRRRVYLQLLAELLIDDCTRLAQFWQDPTQVLLINYQSLQTGSRLQLWQAAINAVVNNIEAALTPVPVTAEDNQADTLATEADGEATSADDFVQHNIYADQEARVIAAQLRGLAMLLYGNPDSEDQDPANQLAAWIKLPAATPTTDQPAPLLVLQDSFKQVIAMLSSQSSWPLAEADLKTVQTLLTAIQAAVQPTPLPTLESDPTETTEPDQEPQPSR